jgi:hypothetical protein
MRAVTPGRRVPGLMAGSRRGAQVEDRSADQATWRAVKHVGPSRAGRAPLVDPAWAASASRSIMSSRRRRLPKSTFRGSATTAARRRQRDRPSPRRHRDATAQPQPGPTVLPPEVEPVGEADPALVTRCGPSRATRPEPCARRSHRQPQAGYAPRGGRPGHRARPQFRRAPERPERTGSTPNFSVMPLGGSHAIWASRSTKASKTQTTGAAMTADERRGPFEASPEHHEPSRHRPHAPLTAGRGA